MISLGFEGMKRQDILSIFITFAVGFFVGVYLYVSGFAGLLSEFSVDDQASVNEFVITADAYGGCRSDCPSFQVQSDGSYRYLFNPQRGAEAVLRQGTLPFDVRREVRTAITQRALAQQSREIEPVQCASFTDGTDVVYEITVDGVSYTLDSCGTEIDAESKLWQALNELWMYFGSI